jgi:hypothetical protein
VHPETETDRDDGGRQEASAASEFSHAETWATGSLFESQTAALLAWNFTTDRHGAQGMFSDVGRLAHLPCWTLHVLQAARVASSRARDQLED